MNSDKVMPLAGHLHELRRALIVSALAVAAASLVVFGVLSSWLLEQLTRPLYQLEVPVIATRVTEMMAARIKVSIWGGFVLAFPVVARQVWSFFAPALTKRERLWTLVLVPVSVVLFGLGVAFAYRAVLPLTVKFLLLTVASGFSPLITIREYLSFILVFFVPFGLAFQLPLVVLVLGRLRLVSPALLARRRKHALLAIAVLAAVLTGPDVVSQLLLGLPVYILYEISIWVLVLSHRLASRKMRRVQPEASGS